MTKRPEPKRYVLLNLGLMKIRLVSAYGLLFFCYQPMHCFMPEAVKKRPVSGIAYRILLLPISLKKGYITNYNE
jgi:hypothetical protein